MTVTVTVTVAITIMITITSTITTSATCTSIFRYQVQLVKYYQNGTKSFLTIVIVLFSGSITTIRVLWELLGCGNSSRPTTLCMEYTLPDTWTL